MKRAAVFLTILAFCLTAGCRSARTRTTDFAAGTVSFLAEGILNGIFDDDETILERQRREGVEREWKQAWRDNPDANPNMTAAYKNDYQ